jgi:hypothetical protein
LGTPPIWIPEIVGELSETAAFPITLETGEAYDELEVEGEGFGAGFSWEGALALEPEELWPLGASGIGAGAVLVAVGIGVEEVFAFSGLATVPGLIGLPALATTCFLVAITGALVFAQTNFLPDFKQR